MKEIRTVWGQTLTDVAVQEYGHVSGLFLILEDNPNVVSDFADVPQVGTPLLIRDIPVLSDNNRAIAAEFARQNKLVVSGIAPNYFPPAPQVLFAVGADMVAGNVLGDGEGNVLEDGEGNAIGEGAYLLLGDGNGNVIGTFL